MSRRSASRLGEMRETLNIQFPVYVLFTKADLVAGFSEYFGGLDEERRRKVWGATFQTADRGRNMVGDAPVEFDALARRLSEEMPDRLQEEPDPVARITAFSFAAQFSALRERVGTFLKSVFETQGTPASATLRGFYFSSGTQEGTPIDQLLGTLGRSFGSNASRHLSGGGKSFFLHDLLSRLIFAESGWVSHDSSADRRAKLARYGTLSAIMLAALAVLGVFGWSFAANRSLVAATQDGIGQYRQVAAQLLASPTVADVDLENVIGALDVLRSLAVGYDNRDQPTPIQATFGLGQRERLMSAAQTAYRQALERNFRSRLLLQLERTIQAKMADPAGLYEPLKIYLMLGGKAPKADDSLIVSWLKNDWEQNRYPGAHNREGRDELEKHLRAMLALDDEYDPVFELNTALVQSAQRSLGRMTVADRASALIGSAIYAAGLSDFSVASKAGPEAPLVFERVDGSDLATLRVPGIYTAAGFNDFYLLQMSRIAQTLVDDQWVFGGGGEQGGIDQELLRLGPDLLDRYGKDFAAAWNGAFEKMKFKSMSADKPDYLALSAVAAPTSPVKQLFEAVAKETFLTQDSANATDDPEMAKGLSRIGIELPTGKSQNRAGGAFTTVQDPGTAIEAQFRPFQDLVSGRTGQRPIDALVQNFREIFQSLKLAADVPAQAERASANLQLQIATLRTNASRLPRQLSVMVRAVADDFEGDVAETSMATLNQRLAEAVTAPCEEITADRYPFAGGSKDDVPIVDFAKLFAPGGVLDRFFAQNLSGLADMGGQSWDWKQDSRLGRELSKTTLRNFQQAAEIRNAFFPLGGSAPAVNFTLTPFSLNGDADMGLLDVNGQIVQSYQTGNTPSTITWPGSSGSNSAHLSLTPELPGRDSGIKFDGPWAFKRLLDAGTVTANADKLEARFVIGGRDVSYTMEIPPPGNPFSLPALSAFRCPKAF